MSESVAAELAWLLDLLVQDARYAEPALEELDRTLLPGVERLRPFFKERVKRLWNDGLPGCPELLIVTGQAGCVLDGDPHRLFAWLSTLPAHYVVKHELLTEPARNRRLVRARLSRLGTDVILRRAYRDLLKEIWGVAAPRWQSRGRLVARTASLEWARRLKGAENVVQLMPPRHPLARMTPAAAARLFRRRPRFAVVPIYFCMSGGELADLGDQLLIGVPASALEPARRARDAAFVADRMRTFSEPTRMRILIHLLGEQSGVMKMTRALRMTQPTVSEHVRVLVAAGLVRSVRRGGRTVYVASHVKTDRLIEDARATLARWGATEGRSRRAGR